MQKLTTMKRLESYEHNNIPQIHQIPNKGQKYANEMQIILNKLRSRNVLQKRK